MLKINISEEDKKILQSEVYNQFHPSVMRKMDALRLKSFNMSNSDICKILDIHPNTLRSYFCQYMEGGIERLKEVRFRRPTSDLAEYSATIESYFIEHPPSSISEASVKIAELTGVVRGETAVRKFLKSLNFKYRKTGSVPKDALTESKKKEQCDFLEAELEPRILSAQSGKLNLYFCDAAHFVCGSFMSYLWCIIKVLLPTLSGRSRYNVLGMINAVSHDFLYTCNESYITATTVCELLRKLRSHHSDNIPITVVLDNARYQCCRLVKDLALELGIELLFLPSYSPNLNLIERYWRWLRKDCLNCKCYDNFGDFKLAIEDSLGRTVRKENESELSTLLNLKFQLF